MHGTDVLSPAMNVAGIVLASLAILFRLEAWRRTLVACKVGRRQRAGAMISRHCRERAVTVATPTAALVHASAADRRLNHRPLPLYQTSTTKTTTMQTMRSTMTLAAVDVVTVLSLSANVTPLSSSHTTVIHR